MSIWLQSLLLFLANIVLLSLYLHLSHKYHWFDHPNEERKLHSVSKPTSAGLVFMISLPFFIYFGNYFESNISLVSSLGLLLFIVLGAFDDFFHISVKIRLLLITIFSLVLVYTIILSHANVSYGIIFVFALGVIWWMNLYNFMDGADGMAALHALVTLIGYLVLFMNSEIQSVNILLILTIASLSAFLIFNFPKSKMFMGDSGSLSVSFLVATIALYGISKQVFDEIVVITFHLTFIVDATLTLFTRLKFRHKISQAHNLHLFQSMINTGQMPHYKVSLIYAFVTLINVSIALIMHLSEFEIRIRVFVLLFQMVVLSIFWFNFYQKTKFQRFRQ